jgi:hypothetical protein
VFWTRNAAGSGSPVPTTDLHRHPPANDLVLDDDGTVVKIIIGSFSDRKGRWTREERMAAMRELRNGNCMRASA